jgi:hypothetical protein
LPGVLSCAAREGGAWCVLDLISRRVPERIVDHWLYRLRKHRARPSPIPVDVFWPRENDAPASLPSGHVEAHPTASEMELKTVS